MKKYQSEEFDSLWFPNIKNQPNSTFRLFCFPYAGGSNVTYNKWSKSISTNIEVCAVQLPGRANLMNEKAFTEVDALVEVLCDKLSAFTDKPLALFGHSMGAIICYELSQKLIEITGTGPVHLFVSGRQAPHIRTKDKITYNLPQDEFIEELKKLNGTPKEVLENADLLEIVLPLLRADFKLVETYHHRNQKPLPCPITVFGGTEDNEVKIKDLKEWKDYTTSKFELQIFDGDHFFINQYKDKFTSIISKALNDG